MIDTNVLFEGLMGQGGAAGLSTVTEETIAHQKASFAALLQSLGQAPKAEIEAVMAQREVVQAEEGLSPEVVSAKQQRIKTQRSQA